MRIQYSPESVDDLVRLREFIEIKNPHAAKRIANEIIQGIEKLKLFPKMGITVKRSSEIDKIRDLFISNYTVRYLVGENDIFILRIWHGKEIEKDL